MILVTGGAGFIGANFLHDWFAQHDEPVVNLDRLTYAGNPDNLAGLPAAHTLVVGDIGDATLLARLFAEQRPRAIVHFAAETHVDRSISAPGAFIQTNVVGTFTLLDAARNYWQSLTGSERAGFRFVHISTDEVYGSLEPDDAPFGETHAYAPNSPYSASKAGADHLVRAAFHTYGLPTLTVHCSNNYGPMQFPEKLIPLMIDRALAGQPLPLYGDGKNIRDWLYVADHCAAIRRVLDAGRPGETYNVGGHAEYRNLDLVQTLCALLDTLQPAPDGLRYARLIRFVADRPGHDRRYAINPDKIRNELGWQPAETFASGLRKTLVWYLAHRDWVARIHAGIYHADHNNRPVQHNQVNQPHPPTPGTP